MAPGISYDDSGSLASYFGVTCLALLLIPATYYILKPPPSDPLKPLCPCTQCQSNLVRLKQLRRGDRKNRFIWRILPLIIAWVVFGYMAWSIYVAPRIAGEVVYNPFEILGLGTSSTEKEIKKHYKKLSLQFHPDKIKLSENQTQEDADSKFVELTKAYKSLTDEVTRENLAKYGNPDGPQQREDKIAIPKWVVEGKNSFWVLGAYGLVLGGGIPWVVGRWWFFQRRLTRDGILNQTAEIFFHSLKDDTDFTSLVALLASAIEFTTILSGKKKLSKKDKKERQSRVEELEKVLEVRKVELGIEDEAAGKEGKVVVSTGVARRAQALIWSHLLRVEPEDSELKSEILEVLRITPPLLNSLLTISLSHNWLKSSLLVIRLQPSLVQALPCTLSPLAQLPGISPEKAVELEIKRGWEGRRWLEKWVKQSPSTLTLVNGDVKAENDVREENPSGEGLDVAKSWPRLEIVSAEFKVTGEKIVTPSSIVSLVYKCRYVYPTNPSKTRTKVPNPLSLPNGDHKADQPNGDVPVKEEKEEVKVENGDGVEVKEESGVTVENIKEEVKEVLRVKGKEGKEGKEVIKAKEIPNGYAHAPYWPQLRKPHFYVLLGDSKLDKIIVQPVRITDIPLPNSDGTPAEPKEYSLQFQAPPQANLYSFVAWWVSETYLGCDVNVPVMLKVEDPPEETYSDDEDISEPEEDTIAGQMAMLRGDKVKPFDSRRNNNDDDDDESGSEDQYESSSSDEEAPKRKRAINEDSETDSD